MPIIYVKFMKRNRRMIRNFNNKKPNIHISAYVDEQATVIGDVTIGEDSALSVSYTHLRAHET